MIDYLKKTGNDQLPDLIVVDYNMPELNGAEVLALIYTSDAILHRNECMNSGASEYFVKPNNLADLELLVRNMLSYCKWTS